MNLPQLMLEQCVQSVVFNAMSIFAMAARAESSNIETARKKMMCDLQHGGGNTDCCEALVKSELIQPLQ